MNTVNRPLTLERGLSLIELLISMAITLVLVLAASLVFLNIRETDATQSKASDSIETGTFALQLLGRDIAQAGSYPVVMPPTTLYFPIGRFMETYPPGPSIPAPKTSDWVSPSTVYLSGIYGCEGGTFNSNTAACDATTILSGSPYRSAPDSIVINYFTNDTYNMATVSSVGNRRDCTGSDAGNDTVNAIRKLNKTPSATIPPSPTAEDQNLPPHLPLFVSNRYGLSADSTIEIDKQTIKTRSLACNGNGASGSKIGTLVSTYQPILLGVEDLQITYGAFDGVAAGSTLLSLAPTRFYTATEINALPSITVDTTTYKNWDRVSAVRVCLMTATLGSNTRIKGASGSLGTYLDCTDDSPQTYTANDNVIRKRHVQVFAVRNRLTQSY